MDRQESPRASEEREWSESPSRRERSRSRRAVPPVQGLERRRPWLSRRTRETLTLIGVNAALSLVISLAVVVVWDAVVRSPAPASAPVAVATETATPTSALPTMTFTPGPGAPTIYRIQAGDTLLTIASQFGVTVEAIMAANGLENANFIQTGQELLIPVGGLPETMPTDTPLPQPTETPAVSTVAPPEPAPTPTPIPTGTPTPPPVTPPATEPKVTIRQVLGAGVLADEAVFIFNSGRAVRMEGWTLTDAQDTIYAFPNLFLGTGGSVRVHTGPGSNSATDLYWGLDAPVWGEPGDVATLRDESGLVIDTLELP
ncbi:MAG: lamin tail domain-containing protein [Anaerolineae bacterium]|nr:MAG: lamin tail domain-containing protein [Anaerolineae bacterium]